MTSSFISSSSESEPCIFEGISEYGLSKDKDGIWKSVLCAKISLKLIIIKLPPIEKIRKYNDIRLFISLKY
ncbi:hypothetical protein NARC_10087 [Candidatus Nitrosocosmicus arcticus]|uniref:Uncharacterized protein n=1 Tax=Candidatus Nitrosocosmicus arcticus TaxID=2035267 RepID=A0A557SYK5_9ARCH|nr:hypothetical protein NARC_10087 [Candidatus Nitrosocosmicus arcticus]